MAVIGKKMIFVNFNGGLGNQIFQYAFAKSISKMLKDECIISLDNSYENDTLRNFSLKKFKVNLIDDNKKYSRSKKSVVLKVKIFVHGIANCKKRYLDKMKFLNFLGIYVEEKHQLYVPKLSHAKIKIISGLFHHEEYFRDFKQELIDEIQLNPSIEVPNIISSIKSSESVCLHIRRGDYVNYPYYITCSIEYYRKCMAKMRELHPGCVFFVFSDDIQWVKDNLNEDVVYIEGNNPDYIDFELMRNCKHFIISNSTFSWWAAYLGQYENKTVMTPDKWYSDGRNKEWLNLPEWITMETGI